MKRLSLRAEQRRLLGRLASLPAWERVTVARELQEDALAFGGALAQVRSQALLELKASGLSWEEVGELVGLSGSGARAVGQGVHSKARRQARAEARAAESA